MLRCNPDGVDQLIIFFVFSSDWTNLIHFFYFFKCIVCFRLLFLAKVTSGTLNHVWMPMVAALVAHAVMKKKLKLWLYRFNFEMCFLITWKMSADTYKMSSFFFPFFISTWLTEYNWPSSLSYKTNISASYSLAIMRNIQAFALWR